MAVYGLSETAGLTPQNWEEGSLTYNTTGSEFVKPVATDVDLLMTNDLVLLGTLPAGSPDSTVLLAGSTLDSFVASRAGKIVTLILANDFNKNRAVFFHSRETTTSNATPTLTLWEPGDPFYPNADANVRGGNESASAPVSNYNTATLQVRTLSDGGAALRGYYSFVRFDFSGFNGVESGAKLTFTPSPSGQAWSSGQFQLFGLPDKPGLTPQNWGETEITYNTLGDEFNKPMPIGATPIHEDMLVLIDDQFAGVLGMPTVIEGPALDAFLNSRAGGVATFIIANKYGAASRNGLIYSRETTSLTNAPYLTFTPLPPKHVLSLVVLH
jgi:hypothetical protein